MYHIWPTFFLEHLAGWCQPKQTALQTLTYLTYYSLKMPAVIDNITKKQILALEEGLKNLKNSRVSLWTII